VVWQRSVNQRVFDGHRTGGQAVTERMRLSYLILLSTQCGCTDSRALPVVDGAGEIDNPLLDTDGDGLCDATEQSYGSDPFSIDTDADTVSDYTEVRLGFDPNQPASPPRDTVLTLAEGSTAHTRIDVTVDGMGQTFTGAFEPIGPVDSLGRDARGFYERSVALTATPPDNVVAVIEAEERFRIVLGTTRLVFEVRFAFGDNPVTSCINGYGYFYTVRDQSGSIYLQDRRLLFVLPRERDAPWCVLDSPCR